MSIQPVVTYCESWRADFWNDDIPSRPGWIVTCPEHGPLGHPPGWAYAKSGSAYATATRHYHRWHLGLIRTCR